MINGIYLEGMFQLINVLGTSPCNFGIGRCVTVPLKFCLN